MNGQAAPGPREWVADWPFPWPATRSLPDGALVRACFGLVELQLARTRADQPYLRLTLSDRFGLLDARVWTGAEELAGRLKAGGYVGVQGHVEYFNGQLQLCLDTVETVRVELDDLALFLPCSRRPPEEMESELRQLIGSVQDGPFRLLLERCLGSDSEIGAGFRLAPAAKYNHHAYLGGLLEHTLSVAAVCDRLAAHYGAALDRDLLVTAALLHDIGKVREIGARSGFPYTDEGKLLGHILLGLEMVNTAARTVPGLDPGRLLLLQHLIAAHQGRYEWQSPREPATLEAIVLHYADDLDAKLQQVQELISRGEGAWTAYDRAFRREFLRPRTPTSNPASEAAEPRSGSEEANARECPEQNDVELPPIIPSAPALTAPGGGVRRPGRHHGPSSFHRLSEDTLDLFRDAD